MLELKTCTLLQCAAIMAIMLCESWLMAQSTDIQSERDTYDTSIVQQELAQSWMGSHSQSGIAMPIQPVHPYANHICAKLTGI